MKCWQGPPYKASTEPYKYLQVLASLHMIADRVHLSDTSSQQAQEANQSNAVTQCNTALVATWNGLLRDIALDPSLADGDFACIFDDDIALHYDVSLSVAWRALLHGMDLARKDGLLFLSSCGPTCWDEPSEWLGKVEYKKCDTPCAHAHCVTKRKSGTLMSEVMSEWKADNVEHNHASIGVEDCMNQMLRAYAEQSTSAWTVGTNLWPSQCVWYGDQLSGLFGQDRAAQQDQIWLFARSLRKRSRGIISASTYGADSGKGQAGLFPRCMV